jgi:hypothetical protein
MGVFKAQGLKVGKTLQHIFAFCPSTSEDSFWVRNSVSKLGPDEL